MIGITVIAAAVLAVLLCLVTLLQLLHMEAVRFRPRELPALTFFKETLQQKVGLSVERGALAFSLMKHTLILLLVVVFLLPVFAAGPFWEAALEAILFAWIIMLVATYMAPHLLYRKTSGRWLMPLMPLLRAMAVMITPLVHVLGFFESLVELAQTDTVN